MVPIKTLAIGAFALTGMTTAAGLDGKNSKIEARQDPSSTGTDVPLVPFNVDDDMMGFHGTCMKPDLGLADPLGISQAIGFLKNLKKNGATCNVHGGECSRLGCYHNSAVKVCSTGDRNDDLILNCASDVASKVEWLLKSCRDKIVKQGYDSLSYINGKMKRDHDDYEIIITGDAECPFDS
ncbi:hypothetical protein MKZ38_003428 [Zalerion maritima]|uniref:Uncharacterized protein n=1 Tax=Zalerion maritima TaxID=339359 RepID=A0AAD5RUF3_9PEZI|nr:hypothetical protein MKZ38_003428 [Zalerion maritima]